MAAMTTDQARAFLVSLLPRGYDRWFDLSPTSDPGKILTGAAEQFALRVSAPAEAADADNNPWTLTHKGLAAWEVALGLTGTSGANDATRKAAVISKLREHGASDLPGIRAIIGPMLGYLDPTQLVILETSRASLTAAHAYTNSTPGAIVGGGSLTRSITVGDAPKVSDAGAQIYFDNLAFTDGTDLTVTLTAPDSTAKTWNKGIFFAAGDGGILYAPEFADKAIGGAWTVQVSSASHNVSWDDANLVVEAIGWQTVMGGAEGLGAAIYKWAVQVDPALVGATGVVPNYAAIRDTIQRIQPAHCRGYLVFKATGGGACSVWGDPNAIWDAGTWC